MVCASAEDNQHNIFEGLEEGYITRGDLQYCAENLLNYILNSPTFKKFVLAGCVKPKYASIDETEFETVAVIDDVVSGEEYNLTFDADKKCVFVFETECKNESLAQYPVTLNVGGKNVISFSISSNDSNKTIRQTKLSDESNVFSFKFPNSINLKKFTIKQ